MNSDPIPSRLAKTLRFSALTFMAAFALQVSAQTLWTGPNITFTQSVANGTSADVIIPGAVSLTRNGSSWMYNTNRESGPIGTDPSLDPPVVGSPTDTEWAFGTATTAAEAAGLSYQYFDTLRNGDLSGVLTPDKPMIVHLINENIYIPIMFLSWPHGGGAISYVRATAGAVVPPTPTVTIDSPSPGMVYAAPANVKIAATANVASGTVTNVTFIGNTTVLGSDPTAPFSLTTSSLGVGAYALKAVATATGISGTSSVVNITVVAPVNVSLSSQKITNSVFSFDYTANPGLRYVVENSSNLVNWVPVVTNLAAGSPVHFTQAFSATSARYFRVGRQPNP